MEDISRTPEGPACIKPVTNEDKVRGENESLQVMSSPQTESTTKAKIQPGEQMGLTDRPEIRRSGCPSCSSVVTLAI